MKKILSIDGGGIKGIYAASFFAVIEEKCKVSICDYFDLIAGTSTGGIIAAALAYGIPAKNILELYFQEGKNIFPRHRIWSLGSGKYDTYPLKNALEKVFSDVYIKDCKTRLLMPAYNLTTNKVRVFKTPHAPDLYIDKDLKVVDCVLATTAAPLFFVPYAMSGGVFVDGGVGANNPSLIALVEALTRCGWDLSDIALLSIGSTNELGPAKGNEKMGLKDALTVQKCFMNAESQYADNICRIMLCKDQYIRVNQEIMKAQVALDKATVEAMNLLKSWGEDQAMNYIADINKLFLESEKEDVIFYNT